MKSDFEYSNIRSIAELTDLALVAALRCQGFSIESINRDPKNYPKVSFLFFKSNQLQETINAYWEGSLLIEPKTYWHAIRELKSRIKAE